MLSGPLFSDYAVINSAVNVENIIKPKPIYGAKITNSFLTIDC